MSITKEPEHVHSRNENGRRKQAGRKRQGGKGKTQIKPSCSSTVCRQQTVERPIEIVLIFLQRGNGIRTAEAHTAQLLDGISIISERWAIIGGFYAKLLQIQR
jgi:hypothetical protein